MALTDTAARKALPAEKPYKLAAGGGLYLYVATTGAKTWRYDYRLAGRRHTLTIGAYPTVTAKAAAARHFEARRQVEAKQHPALLKRQEKRAAKVAAAHTFRELAEQWLADRGKSNSEGWRKTREAWLKGDVYPVFGDRAIRDVGPGDILDVMERFRARDAALSAELVRGMLSMIFRFAIRRLRADADPAHAVRGAVTVPAVRHHPTLKPAELPAFLVKLDAYTGQPQTRIGLRLLLLTFARKGELAGATWDEIDVESATWSIPASRMKMRDPHVVPLSRQALALLEQLRVLARGSAYVFPNRSDPRRPQGPSRFNDAIAALGYTGLFSPHGARALASTVLNESGWNPDAVERQLAHKERDKVRAAYNRAAYMDERRRMMQAWADLLDQFEAGANVVPLRTGVA